ncbi:hypothetical protein GCM10027280_43030 [Micromonospora polyrhachis]|uniref:Uncharacterized protein n=1 Tax=Micromonospora polyrhachis TaxID=1282883 RepID=A0A7W7SWA8_9ACTN|nr:hypothetical protein [Micromonospora polyrhachis]MBB4962124.1 hypothetical protein [Micromonospora polyrhachis]
MNADIFTDRRADGADTGPVPSKAAESRPSSGIPRWGLVAVLLLASWAVPAGAYAVHAAWLLPPLVLIGTASLLRGGRTLLDRLMLATGLLIGMICAVGLLFSIWPWGLHPVPVSGAAFTVLLAVAVLTGRRPAFPRPSWTDGLSIGAALLLIGYLSVPYLRASGFTQRLGFVMMGEDNSRHIALFDVIGRMGGYLFVDEAGAREHIFSGLIYYPQGWHLTAALLDGFVRQSGTAPGGSAAVDHYVFWTLAGFGLLALSLIWAAQWVAGQLHALHRLVLVGAAVALCLGTELPRLLVYGYPTEAVGLALTALVAAVAIRPLAGMREQLALMGALLVAIGFVYYLFVFPAGVMVALWLVADRRAVATRRGTLIAVALLTAVLAPLTALLGVLVADQSDALAAGGPAVETAYDTLLGLVAVVGIGLVARSGLGNAIWRRYLAALLVTLGFAFAVWSVNVYSGIKPGYYFGKSTHLGIVLLIIGLGAVIRLLPTPEPATGPTDDSAARLARATVRRWLQPATVAAFATLAIFAGSGVVGWTGGFFRIPDDTTWSRKWVERGFQKRSLAEVVAAAERQFPAVPGTTTLIVDQSAMHGYIDSMFLSAMQGTTGETEPGIYGMKFVEPERTRRILTRLTGPVRLIVAHQAGLDAVNQVLVDDPGLAARVTIVHLAR